MWGVTVPTSSPTPTTTSFNPHARVGRDSSKCCLLCPLKCFNPHARVGRDRHGSSIHHFFMCFNPHARVGRDLHRKGYYHQTKCFNPQARVGRDFYTPLGVVSFLVSIHTPVWGVTVGRCASQRFIHVSIHTPVWGVTISVIYSFSFH